MIHRCQTSFSNQHSYIFLFRYYLFLLGLSWPDLVCQASAECQRICPSPRKRECKASDYPKAPLHWNIETGRIFGCEAAMFFLFEWGAWWLAVVGKFKGVMLSQAEGWGHVHPLIWLMKATSIKASGWCLANAWPRNVTSTLEIVLLAFVKHLSIGWCHSPSLNLRGRLARLEQQRAVDLQQLRSAAWQGCGYVDMTLHNMEIWSMNISKNNYDYAFILKWLYIYI